MKFIKSYKLFESVHNDQFFKTYEETKNWLDNFYVKNYTINKDLTVDVNGEVSLSFNDLDFIPVQFGVVTRNFDCSNNNLKNLKGCPNKTRYFDCQHNKLESLEGCPFEINGLLDCTYNNLKKLDCGPIKISGIYGGISCSNNKLDSLEGCPKVKNLYFDNNDILDLKGLPIGVEGIFFHNNPISNILCLIDGQMPTFVKKIIKFAEYLNEYDVINGNVIYLERLKEALYMIDEQDKFPYNKLYLNEISSIYSIV